jgi:dTMP kinase
VRFINEFAVGDRRPDLTFVLDVESEETRRRLLRRPRPVGAPDRMEQMPPEFYDAVRAGYQALARDNPGRFRVIQAGRSVEAVEMEVWEHVSELIKSAPGS